MLASVVEPEPPFLTGAGAVKKEAAQAPALICTGTGSYLKIRTKQYHVPVMM